MSPRLLAAVAPALAAASGLAVLAAHPPLGWWWTTFLAPPLLLAALAADARDAREAGRRGRGPLLGLLMGAICFGPLLSWLILPVGYLGWGLLAAVQAAWFGLLGLLLGRVIDHPLLPLAAAAAWTGIDAWRALVPLNGFEWGAIAYAHTDASWMLPVARLIGGRGITFLTVLIGAAAFVVVRRTLAGVRGRGPVPLEEALTGLRLPLTFLVGGLLVSVLATIEPPPTNGELDVLVVQGNDVRHWEGPRPADTPRHIAGNARDLTLAAVAEGGRPDLAVWPESSIDRDPWSERGANLRPLVADAAEAAGTLLAGTTVDGPDPARTRYVAASLYVDGFEEVDRYAKQRLVPFGEYIPARPLFAWYPPLEQVPRDTIPGEPHTITLPNGSEVAPIICYETLFQGIVRRQVLHPEGDAGLIVTLTNNASYGDSAMPFQHLAQSRLRAVETGRWVVHAAVSGSSAFLAPDGTIEQATALFEQATIRRSVPLVDGRTPFLAVGDVLGWLTRALVVAGIAALVLGWAAERARRNR